MRPANFTVKTQTAVYIFGIAWFLPYSVYGLWVYGARPIDMIGAAFFSDGTLDWLWRLAASNAATLTLFLQLTVGFLLVVRSGTLSWSMLGFRPTSAVWFLVALVGLVSIVMFTGLLHAVIQVPGHVSAGSAANAGARPGHTINYYLAILLLLVPVIAIVEEVAFRGVLYGWLRANIGPNAGIALSALIFSLVHLRFLHPEILLGIGATLQLMFIGIILALLYEKSGSLWPSVYLHGVNNAIAVIQTAFVR